MTVAGKPRVESGKVKLRITLAQPGGYRAVLRLRGKAIARKNGLGDAVTIKLPAKHAKAVRRLGCKSRALTLVVTAGSAAQTVVVAPR